LTARVLELKKRTRMVWFWSDGSEEHGQTRIMFELRTEGDGTRRFVTVATRGTRWGRWFASSGKSNFEGSARCWKRRYEDEDAHADRDV
jgi:hypothetical protein